MRLLHFLLYLVNSVSCSYLSLSQFMTNFHTVQVKKVLTVIIIIMIIRK